ncbi:MAG: hypothetical protein ACE37J_00005, partial [Pikeienuella sp.]|uniref:hypothetical protein n=1 Tax=Pikeienuella sp. TaxID=2831957 RepID=UPI00391A7F76
RHRSNSSSFIIIIIISYFGAYYAEMISMSCFDCLEELGDHFCCDEIMMMMMNEEEFDLWRLSYPSPSSYMIFFVEWRLLYFTTTRTSTSPTLAESPFTHQRKVTTASGDATTAGCCG